MLQKTIAHSLFKKIKYGDIKVTYWDGDSRVYGSSKSPKLHVTIKDPGLISKMAKNISLAVGEAFMDKRLLIDGSLDEFISIGYKNDEILGFNKPHKYLQKNIKRFQKKQIAHHYDLGNDFYELWLDPSMTYTCAYFKTPSDSLEKAQTQKRQHVLNKLRIDKGMDILDIGCGWGGLLIEAALKYGANGIGVTLSEEQFKFANERIKKLGLSNKIEVRLMNYLDVPKLNIQFDRVVSIGFFEAVGKDNLNDYFRIIDKVLKPGGASVLHTIANNVEYPTDAWIDKYIFPGGYIPSLREVANLLPNYGLFLKDFESLGMHYSKTLRHWRDNFEAHKSEVIKMYNERFYRMWSFYLAGAIGSFDTGRATLAQFVFTKGPATDWQMTRDYLYK